MDTVNNFTCYYANQSAKALVASGFSNPHTAPRWAHAIASERTSRVLRQAVIRTLRNNQDLLLPAMAVYELEGFKALYDVVRLWVDDDQE